MVLRTLYRFGQILLPPRTEVAKWDPAEGARDGIVLSVLYMGAAEGLHLIRAAANFAATQNGSGLLMFASELLRALIAPILVLVVVEAVLGPARAYRRGTCLVPLVVIAGLAHALWSFGVRLPGPVYVPAIAGGLASVALAAWIKPVIVPRSTDGDEPATDPEGAA